MWCRVLRVAGVIVGWGGAVASGLLARWAWVDMIEVTMIFLSMAIVSTLAMVVNCYQQPLAEAFELGYSAGRRDAVREATKAAGGYATVRPLTPRSPLDLEQLRQRREGARLS